MKVPCMVLSAPRESPETHDRRRLTMSAQQAVQDEHDEAMVESFARRRARKKAELRRLLAELSALNGGQ